MSASKSKEVRRLTEIVEQQQLAIDSLRNSPILQQIEVTKSTAYSGPVPSPEMVSEYNRVVPDLGNALVDSYLKEQQFRHDQERKELEFYFRTVQEDQSQKKLGLKMGFVVFFSLIVFAGYAMHLGHIVLAGSIIGIMIGAASVFVRSQVKSQRAGAETSRTDYSEVQDNLPEKLE